MSNSKGIIGTLTLTYLLIIQNWFDGLLDVMISTSISRGKNLTIYASSNMFILELMVMEQILYFLVMIKILNSLSLSRRYIYKFQIFHFLLNNFPSSGNVTKNIIWRDQVFYLFVCDNRNQSGVKQAASSSEKNCDDE